MKLETGTTISRYRLLSAIGKGGMGEVYLAQDTELDRKVAIKFLSEELSKDADKVNRFIQEAKAASALNHPNILTVYEIGTWEDTRYIATEYIEGATLREIIRRKESIPLNKVLKIGIQVAEALSAAHRAGIAHRDIKPENIMVRDDGYVKVLDFGLAKLTEKKKDGASISLEGETKALVKTNPGVVMGTVSYMSPEQARGQETDERTDVWSLGVVLYEMLAGKVPFTGETTNHTIVAILETEPKLLENIPDELQRIVRKTLTKDRSMRYQNTGDLVIDLKNLRRDLDIQGELERSVIPNTEQQTVPEQSGEAATADGGTPNSTQDLTTASSLEYAVTQAKTHKLATAVIAVLLIGIISVASYFAFFSGTSNRIDSIAVMPFVNEGGDPDLEYLSDGMTETLINSLSEVPDLSVKARSLVFQYKGKQVSPATLASELGVRAILTGRLVKRGDQVSLSVELIDGGTQNTLWGKKYERPSSGLVALQSQLARDLSARLRSTPSSEESTKTERGGTDDPVAYQAYLKGRYYWNRRNEEYIKKAIEQFRIATDRDPGFALAYAGLADCYTIYSEYTGTPGSESVPQAKAFAEKALSLESSLGAAHATLGSVATSNWDWVEAERQYKKAIELDPDYATTYHWYSILLRHLGRFEEAETAIDRAAELDPLSNIIAVNVEDTLRLKGDVDGSVSLSSKLIEHSPEFAPAYGRLGHAYLVLGRREDAIAAFEKAVKFDGRSSNGLGDLGYGYASAGRRQKALALLKEIEDRYTQKKAKGVDLAIVFVGLGDKDQAFEWLEKDLRGGDGDLPLIRWKPFWEPLRDDPRYASLLMRMGLKD